MSITGIDLSNHNYQRQVPDFEKVKDAGYSFVVIKLTEGVNYIDPAALEMAQAAKAAGLLISYYHFATPGGSKVSGGYKAWWDAEDEARDFVKALGDMPAPDLCVALDFEWSKDHLEAVGMDDPEKLTRWAVEWLQYVEEAIGHRPMFYTYPNYMGRLDLPNAELSRSALWLSHFTNDLNRPPKFEEEWGWDSYTVWQWTSKGEVPGLEGDTDLNTAESLDEISLADCGMPLSAQIDQHVEAIETELEGLRQISKTLKGQSQ